MFDGYFGGGAVGGVTIDPVLGGVKNQVAYFTNVGIIGSAQLAPNPQGGDTHDAFTVLRKVISTIPSDVISVAVGIGNDDPQCQLHVSRNRTNGTVHIFATIFGRPSAVANIGQLSVLFGGGPNIVPGVANLAGGSSNTASGSRNGVLGFFNQITGDDNFGTGSTNTCSGDQSGFFGESININAPAENSFGAGQNLNIRAIASAAFGDKCNISADYGFLLGTNLETTHTGNVMLGDAQGPASSTTSKVVDQFTTRFENGVRYTDAVPGSSGERVEYERFLETDRDTATPIFTLTPATDKAYLFEFSIVARRTNGSGATANECAIYKRICRIKNDGGTITINGNTAIVVNEDVAAWNADFALVGSNIEVQCTGVAGVDIDWNGTFRVMEV